MSEQSIKESKEISPYTVDPELPSNPSDLENERKGVGSGNTSTEIPFEEFDIEKIVYEDVRPIDFRLGVSTSANGLGVQGSLDPELVSIYDSEEGIRKTVSLPTSVTIDPNGAKVQLAPRFSVESGEEGRETETYVSPTGSFSDKLGAGIGVGQQKVNIYGQPLSGFTASISIDRSLNGAIGYFNSGDTFNPVDDFTVGVGFQNGLLAGVVGVNTGGNSRFDAQLNPLIGSVASMLGIPTFLASSGSWIDPKADGGIVLDPERGYIRLGGDNGLEGVGWIGPLVYPKLNQNVQYARLPEEDVNEGYVERVRRVRQEYVDKKDLVKLAEDIGLDNPDKMWLPPQDAAIYVVPARHIWSDAFRSVAEKASITYGVPLPEDLRDVEQAKRFNSEILSKAADMFLVENGLDSSTLTKEQRDALEAMLIASTAERTFTAFEDIPDSLKSFNKLSLPFDVELVPDVRVYQDQDVTMVHSALGVRLTDTSSGKDRWLIINNRIDALESKTAGLIDSNDPQASQITVNSIANNPNLPNFVTQRRAELDLISHGSQGLYQMIYDVMREYPDFDTGLKALQEKYGNFMTLIEEGDHLSKYMVEGKPYALELQQELKNQVVSVEQSTSQDNAR